MNSSNCLTEVSTCPLRGLCCLQDPNVGEGAKQWFASWKSWMPQEPGVYFETNGWDLQSLNMLSEAFAVSWFRADP